MNKQIEKDEIVAMDEASLEAVNGGALAVTVEPKPQFTVEINKVDLAKLGNIAHW